MINIESNCQIIENQSDSFDVFKKLQTIYSDDELFLLESLSGPTRDMTQAVIGFQSIFKVKIFFNHFEISANSDLLEKISSLLFKKYQLINIDEESTIIKFKMPDTFQLWDVLRDIEKYFSVKYTGEKSDLRFGYFGYMSYDTIHSIEKIPLKIADDKNMPLVCMSIFQGLIHLDLQAKKCYLVNNIIDENIENHLKIDTAEIIKLLSNKTNFACEIKKDIKVNNTKDIVSYKEYLKMVEKGLYHIGLGDIYQIQFGHEIHIKADISPIDTYQRLRVINPSPYMYYSKFDDMHIIGASPELFIRIDSKSEITMRPIAGTVKRGATESENTMLQEQLLADPKERAEHIMLVDLGRNDVGRVCKKHTLEVDELMIIEQYSHVSHIVSNVIGIKADDKDKYDVLSATFPAGTMTGSPKVRAMEIIEDTETSRRGLYAGCIGFIGFNDIVETALCIRTATYQNETYTIRASGGIVSDSTPEGEWQETLSKLSATYFAITNRDLRKNLARIENEK